MARRPLGVLKDVVHRQDVGMPQPGQRGGLAARRRRSAPTGQLLKCHLTLEPGIDLPDRAVCTTRHHPDTFVITDHQQPPRARCVPSQHPQHQSATTDTAAGNRHSRIPQAVMDEKISTESPALLTVLAFPVEPNDHGPPPKLRTPLPRAYVAKPRCAQ